MATQASDQAARRGGLFAQADPAEPPQGGITSPVSLVLLLILLLFFLWGMRRRRIQEERFRELRRQETVTHAEESARNIAHIMRQAPTRATAEAAATEGLAAAARVPTQPVATDPEPEPTPDQASENGAAEIEIAERELLSSREAAAARAAEAADREAIDAARRAGLEDPSESRQTEAGQAASGEVAADDIDIERVEIVDPLDGGGQSEFTDPIDAADIVAPEVDVVKVDAPVAPEEDARAALRAGLTALEAEAAVDVPFGAVVGDGSATCPADYPIKGNRQSHIYHEPGQSSYAATIPEFCFASREAAEAAGYRQSRARGGRPHA
jgi:hypothetical protein